jgi:FkbM family methyltransferase
MDGGLIRRVARLIPRDVRNWLRSPAATLAWAWDDVRHRAGADRLARIREDWLLRCHPAAYRMAYQAHVGDPEQVLELDTFIAACTPGMVLFDLGAHFGLFALAATRYGGAGARAVALDPSGFACRMIREQARLNGVAARITVVEAAIAAASGRQAMIPVGVIAAGYYSAATEGHGAGEREEVRAVTVDDLARELDIWPTHMKIDVEGAEAAALLGAGAALARDPAPVLFLELHNAMVRARGADPGETLDLLAGVGYQVQGLDNRPLSRATILAQPLIRVVARREAA